MIQLALTDRYQDHHCSGWALAERAEAIFCSLRQNSHRQRNLAIPAVCANIGQQDVHHCFLGTPVDAAQLY